MSRWKTTRMHKRKKKGLKNCSRMTRSTCKQNTAFQNTKANNCHSALSFHPITAYKTVSTWETSTQYLCRIIKTIGSFTLMITPLRNPKSISEPTWRSKIYRQMWSRWFGFRIPKGNCRIFTFQPITIASWTKSCWSWVKVMRWLAETC